MAPSSQGSEAHWRSSYYFALVIVIGSIVHPARAVPPEYPWTFDNDLFGGPDFWGLVSREWRLCSAGRLQSPVNIDPTKLLFDPRLTNIKMDTATVEAVFENSGQRPLVVLKPESGTTAPVINISGGPAAPYVYRLQQVIVHFGHASGGEHGSEHTIDRRRFPAEVQLLAYNAELYANFSEAQTQPRGLLGLSIIVDISTETTPELRRLTVASQSITYKGQRTNLRHFQPSALLPRTTDYVTYEGSLTVPGCHETVNWVVYNAPIKIAQEDLAIWNELQKVEKGESREPGYMTPLYRPLKPLNDRLLRTNIDVHFSAESPNTCQTGRRIDAGYRSVLSGPTKVDTISSNFSKNLPKTGKAKVSRKSRRDISDSRTSVEESDEFW